MRVYYVAGDNRIVVAGVPIACGDPYCRAGWLRCYVRLADASDAARGARVWVCDAVRTVTRGGKCRASELKPLWIVPGNGGPRGGNRYPAPLSLAA